MFRSWLVSVPRSRAFSVSFASALLIVVAFRLTLRGRRFRSGLVTVMVPIRFGGLDL